MVLLEAADRPTVNIAAEVPVLPSVTMVSVMAMVGAASLSKMVALPTASAMNAVPEILTRSCSMNEKRSFVSSSVSPMTGTEKVCDGAPPTANHSVPVMAVKSPGASAVPLWVA